MHISAQIGYEGNKAILLPELLLTRVVRQSFCFRTRLFYLLFITQHLAAALLCDWLTGPEMPRVPITHDILGHTHAPRMGCCKMCSCYVFHCTFHYIKLRQHYTHINDSTTKAS